MTTFLCADEFCLLAIGCSVGLILGVTLTAIFYSLRDWRMRRDETNNTDLP